MAQLVYLIINRRILFNVGVRGRDVGFGLVVVIVGDKIFHRILREIFLELAVELRGKGFVVGNDEGRLLDLLDYICHGEGLARTRNP